MKEYIDVSIEENGVTCSILSRSYVLLECYCTCDKMMMCVCLVLVDLCPFT